MPKKTDKKDVNKQDGKREAPKEGALETPGTTASLDDRETDLYLIQIRYLHEQLEGYHLKCDQLEREKKDLSSQYISLEKEKKDIVEYLKHSLLEKEEEVDELTERLEIQRQAADEDRHALQLQNSHLRKELQDQITKYNTENMTLVARLDSLDEFQKDRERLMSNMKSLEEQLCSQEEHHRADLHSLEVKALMEKKRLEMEMESHVTAMAANMQHQVEKKVPETIRTTLQENTELRAHLKQLSVHTQALIAENSALQYQKGRLSLEVENLEQMLKETCRQNCILQKRMEKLTEKSQQLQTKLKEHSHELKQLQNDHTGVQSELVTLREKNASLTEQCRKNRGELSHLRAELQEERRKRSRMNSIMQETADRLREALTDVAIEQDTEVDCVNQWKQLMQRLLMVLDRPNFNISADESDPLTNESDPLTAAGDVTLSPDSSFQFEMARYRLDDLGIVPRPSAKHKSTSGSTHKTLLRKPSNQKTTSTFNPADFTVKPLTARGTFTKINGNNRVKL